MADITDTVSKQTKQGWKGFSTFMFLSTSFVLIIVGLMALFLL